MFFPSSFVPHIMKKLISRERIYAAAFGIPAFACLFFLAGITLVLFKEGLPLFAKVRPWDFLSGTAWYPTHEDPEFGILPLLAGGSPAAGTASRPSDRINNASVRRRNGR